MLIVNIPDNFIPEREYSIYILFDAILGIPYKIETNTEHDYHIILPDAKKIIIKDLFFSMFTDGLEYLHENNIPEKINYVQNTFAFEESIPIIYGNEELSFNNKHITCGIDIFASTFFMCSRWEEYANSKRDIHLRFSVQDALAYKNNFLHRPIVNEYAEMLWKMLIHLGYDSSLRREAKPEIVFTHDIDLLSKPVKIKDFAKDILVRQNLKAFFKRIVYLLQEKNPFDTFDAFMDISEGFHTKSRFYFMSGHNVKGKDGEDYNNSPLFKNVIKRIKKRQHHIGFHPSFNSYKDLEMFKKEKNILEELIEQQVKEGRQHVLRFEVPVTWQIWEDANMEIDSTMGYSAHEGFRCGTGTNFRVYNCLTRKMLKLQERPLIVMDTTLHINKKNSLNEAKEIIRNYIIIGEKYKMPITLLFHNNIFDEIDWKGWEGLCKSLFFSKNIKKDLEKSYL